MGHVEMIKLLLEHGANLEAHGHYGTALGFAVHYADATVTVPLFVLLDGGPPRPHKANLLYIALGLRHPSHPLRAGRMRAETPAEWQGDHHGNDSCIREAISKGGLTFGGGIPQNYCWNVQRG
ncbi:hypothetical protein B0H16DRAFT_1887070 [Mycena metata]|uniref:Ankyrin repeat protein n=1 Tax=Mycena metata TaxID=1033252 RepID=A0AAD7IY08_9AGAR|nr:hypothetical protein B0H16DRAFT_1887070 [Mycena metata]